MSANSGAGSAPAAVAQLQRVVAAQQTTLSRVIEVSTAAICVFTARGAVIEWNPAAQGIFGYTRGETSNALLDRILAPESAQFVRTIIAAVERGHPSPHLGCAIEVVGKRKEGGEFPLEIAMTAFPGLTGEWLFALVGLDTSVRKEAEALRALTARQDAFISTVSHETRTPLTTIQAVAQILLAEQVGPLSAAQRELVVMLAENTQRAVALINDIILLQEALCPQRQPCALLPLVQEVVALHSQPGIRFEVAVADDLQWAIDPRMVRLLLLHLVGNAVKFSPQGGSVRVSLVEAEGQLCGEVQDTGIGIDPQYHERVFDRFFQVDSSDTRPYGGTGIGLTLCQKIVVAHGGTIGVRGQTKHGCTVWFTLGA